MSMHDSESPDAEATPGDGLEHPNRVNTEVHQSEPVDSPECGPDCVEAEIVMPGVHTLYVCPANPDIHRAKPGECPDCGADLEAEEFDAPATRREFVCSAHPEVHRAEPGNCPDCGSDLQEIIITDSPDANAEDMDGAPLFWIRLIFSAPFLVTAVLLLWKLFAT